MARIGFDGLAISPLGKGHARTELHAVQALAERGEHELVVFVREPVKLTGVEVVSVRERLTIDWELRGLPRASDQNGLDAFISLSERLPLAGGPAIVVWLFESPVHRIRQNRATGASPWLRGSDLLTALLWRRSLRRAVHVCFGSHATRDEVLANVPELESRSSVVYPALGPGFGPGSSTDRGRYAFHLGSRDPRDNTAAAVEACRRAGIRLLVAGGWQGTGAESLGRVSDEELIDLYRGAAVFLDPSLYEGFGYGILEGMACGVPVIASDVTSIPEVAGDAALLCDPEDADAFAVAIRRVLGDPELAESLRLRGFERAASFTWARTAEGLSAALTRATSTASVRSSEPSTDTSTR
ncbi:MAG: glycosyltransferase family 4 protein [Gaiellaceae bacterium]